MIVASFEVLISTAAARVVEIVRKELEKRYGVDAMPTLVSTVKTTIDLSLENSARNASPRERPPRVYYRPRLPPVPDPNSSPRIYRRTRELERRSAARRRAPRRDLRANRPRCVGQAKEMIVPWRLGKGWIGLRRAPTTKAAQPAVEGRRRRIVGCSRPTTGECAHHTRTSRRRRRRW